MPVDAFSSAVELAAAVRARRCSARELTELYLARIARHNPSLNALCTLDEAGALRRAREADEALARGELWRPLHGVPMSIKDALETAGMRTTGTKRAVRNAFYRLGMHAPSKAVVQALREQGIVVNEELVRQVRFEMLKENSGARAGKATRPVRSPAVRRRPQGFPKR